VRTAEAAALLSSRRACPEAQAPGAVHCCGPGLPLPFLEAMGMTIRRVCVESRSLELASVWSRVGSSCPRNVRAVNCIGRSYYISQHNLTTIRPLSGCGGDSAAAMRLPRPLTQLLVFDLKRVKGHTHAVQERFLVMQSATDRATPWNWRRRCPPRFFSQEHPQTLEDGVVALTGFGCRRHA